MQIQTRTPSSSSLIQQQNNVSRMWATIWHLVLRPFPLLLAVTLMVVDATLFSLILPVLTTARGPITKSFRPLLTGWKERKSLPLQWISPLISLLLCQIQTADSPNRHPSLTPYLGKQDARSSPEKLGNVRRVMWCGCSSKCCPYYDHVGRSSW
jgi:hypothetical protein